MRPLVLLSVWFISMLLLPRAGYVDDQGFPQAAAHLAPEKSREGRMPADVIAEKQAEQEYQIRHRSEIRVIEGKQHGITLPGRTELPVYEEAVSGIDTEDLSADQGPPLHGPDPDAERRDKDDWSAGGDKGSSYTGGAIFNGAANFLEKAVVPLGPARMIRDGIDTAHRFHDRMREEISLLVDERKGESVAVAIDELPDEMRDPLELLLDVEGVNVKVPGVDYALVIAYEKMPVMSYEVGEKIFTIEKIELVKTDRGELIVKVPSDVVGDFERKELRFLDDSGSFDGSIPVRLKNGDVRALARVLAAWARYSPSGFRPDTATEQMIARALIRTVGVGRENPFVSVESSSGLSRALADEIDLIVGKDGDARERIMELALGKGRK